MAEKQDDLGAPAIAAHIRSMTEPRSEEECQVNSLKYCWKPTYLLKCYIELALVVAAGVSHAACTEVALRQW